MLEEKEIYQHIRIHKADNGFVVKYMEKRPNPMASPSMYDEQHVYSDSKEVFEAKDDKSMEKALDRAIARQKELIMINCGMKES